MFQGATSSLTDPVNPGALTGAVEWIERALMGSVAVAVAMSAVAAVGLLLLLGRLDIRRGASVVLGTFILFGAAQIAAGLYELGRSPAVEAVSSSKVSFGPIPQASPSTKSYDPYAGASFPTQK
ncbi:TrbC/VirB2 family protein [Sphingomonas sp. RB1R13]|uniref:TrbC/VirB2 family protein n=1 Tax=Sphingomonas sp. RB1R13 TaxID=3096159 RepID=UPI002FC84AE1